MTKKQIILLAVAALFAVSGVAALPEGNVTGFLGCIVIAAACAFFALRKKEKGQQAVASSATSTKVAETIKTKLVGVTFDNEDGENRQNLLAQMVGYEEITVEKYTFKGEPAAYVKWGDKILGNLSAELATNLQKKYPDATYEARILEITSGGVHTFGCNIELDVIVKDEKPAQSAPTSERIVYVDGKSTKYHNKPDCSGMKNAKGIPLSKAVKKYTACKKCFK